MKERCLAYVVVFFLLAQAPAGLRAQGLYAGAAAEKIQACTDRTLYISGEKIFFKAVVYNEDNRAGGILSRVIYCELITPDGKKVTGMKYLLENGSGHGCLPIPQETISGYYFLKLYTRFMRNNGTDDYRYIMLKIINPLKTEVLPASGTSDTTQAVPGPEVFADSPGLRLSLVKNTFSPRELITLDIHADTGNLAPAGISLSVVPESASGQMYFPVRHRAEDHNTDRYLPETRGLSLSGQFIDKKSGKPVAAANINLSILGNKDILVVRTDSAGRFVFALPPLPGNRDIFLSAMAQPGIVPEILVDNDYCSRPLHLAAPRFTMSGEELKTAFRLALNARIATVFMTDTLPDASPLRETTENAFYGQPTEVLPMDKFIDMPTLEEYFNELPFIAKVKKVGGRKTFWFINPQPEMTMYAPLVLVDWVAVDDLEKVLAMPPAEIEHIEVVNSPDIKGNVTFGGIVSFISKKNDFAGIDLPASGKFINFGFLDDCSDHNLPGILPRNVPDPRNTVYWNPSIPAGTDGNTIISFTAPDTPGKYTILLTGFSRTGGLVRTTKTIVISQ